MLEDERLRVLTVERLVLETICFKFEVDTAVSIVVKIAKALERESCLHRSQRARVELIR
jgi:CTD kinase subunit beta